MLNARQKEKNDRMVEREVETEEKQNLRILDCAEVGGVRDKQLGGHIQSTIPE